MADIEAFIAGTSAPAAGVKAGGKGGKSSARTSMLDKFLADKQEHEKAQAKRAKLAAAAAAAAAPDDDDDGDLGTDADETVRVRALRARVACAPVCIRT